jgi:CHAD domain-containing protein
MALDAKRMQKTMRKLRKLVRKAPKRPTPDNIHDLRTYTRRFEVAVGALKLDSRRNERRLLGDLSRARKRAGKIRDMDVLTSYTANVHSNQQQDCLVQLLEYLGARRYRQAERLQATIKKRRSALRRRLKRASARIDKLIVATNKDPAAAQSRASADAMASAAKLSEELTAAATLNKSNLHPYRLKVKELRYVLQMADSPDTRAFIDSLGEVKDAIGEWHDWEELIAIAADLDEHGPNCKLIQELRKISERTYEQALSLTNQMRKDYLRGSAGAGKHGSVRKPKPAPSLLHTVSTIAS